MTKNFRRTAALGIAILVFLGGCASKPTNPESQGKSAAPGSAKSAKPKPVETVFETGRAAFQRIYATARMWAPDAQPIRLESRPRKEDPKDGRASVWSGTFASPGRRAIRSYIWSGASADDAPDPGVSPGGTDAYNPLNASTRPFDFAFLKTDSDEALKVANKKGGTALLKKSVDLPLRYYLSFDEPKNRLVWRVVYGISENEAKLDVWVNASTGDFVKIEK